MKKSIGYSTNLVHSKLNTSTSDFLVLKSVEDFSLIPIPAESCLMLSTLSNSAIKSLSEGEI